MKIDQEIIQLLPGLSQVGLSRTIAHAISSLPEDIQGLFWANIGLVGGNVKFPGFRNRLLVILDLSSI